MGDTREKHQSEIQKIKIIISEGEERESEGKEGLSLSFPWHTTHQKKTYQGLSVHVV